MKSPSDIYHGMTFATPWRIMGLPMQEFTLGHAKIFDRLNLWNITSADELGLAVLLCALPQEKIQHHLTSRWTQWLAQWWSFRWWVKFTRDKALFERTAKRFDEFILDQTEVPGARAKGNPSPIQTPYLQSVRVTLLSRLNYRQDEIDATPYRRALWDIKALQEINGEVTLQPGREGELDADMKRDADEFAKRYFASKEEIKTE